MRIATTLECLKESFKCGIQHYYASTEIPAEQRRDLVRFFLMGAISVLDKKDGTEKDLYAEVEPIMMNQDWIPDESWI